MPEKTAPQVTSVIFNDTLSSPVSKSFYAKIREMRRDPTIALARWLSVAPILAANWSVEAQDDAPEGAKDFIREAMAPMRGHILSTAFFGCLDFGWQPYEKVLEVNESGLIELKKLKPLLQDRTDILVEPKTGAFKGLYQPMNNWNAEVYLDLGQSLLLNIDVEGTDWYGQSTLKIAEGPYDKWMQAEKGADRYDRKMAGSHWVVHYPFGTTIIDGEKQDNFVVAKRILSTLESSGGIAVPRTISDVVDDLNRDSPDAWKIELINSQGGQTGFIDRMKYLDALKVRAFGFPERAVLEGQYGTKAEAETHSDVALKFQEFRHQRMVQHINWHVVNQLLRVNWGKPAENKVYIQPQPLTDLALSYLRDVYKSILASPNGFDLEYGGIDMEALRDRLEIPTMEDANVDAPGTITEYDAYEEPV